MKFFKYLEEVRQEMRRITWPQRSEVIQVSIFVVIMVVITSLFFFGVDMFFSFLMSLIF